MAVRKSAVTAVLLATWLVAGCVQNPKAPTVTYKLGDTVYNNIDQYFAAVRQQQDAVVAQVAQPAQRLGGKALVVLPSPAYIRQHMAKLRTNQGSLDDFFFNSTEINLAADGRAIEKGHVFDSVEIVRADAPATVPPGDADYELYFDQWATPAAHWTLVRQGGGSQQLVLPPPKAPRLLWLNGLNAAVLIAAADLGAPVERQALPGVPMVGASSGTAFFVDAAGHAITNVHVVTQCKAVKLSLGGGKMAAATVAARDATNDLALLTVTPPQAEFGRLSAALPRQGEEVVAYGFPYAGALSSQGNLSTGIVSALSGIKDDGRQLQISAPVQPGNSGGPLLDYSGNVIGVVSSKLNALRLAAVTGDIAQNINFAIKSSVVLNFLQTNGVKPEPGKAKKVMPLTDVSDRARTFTFMVTCER